MEIDLLLEIGFDGGTSEDALWFVLLRCSVLFKDRRVFYPKGWRSSIPSCNQTWLAGKSPINESVNRKIIDR